MNADPDIEGLRSEVAQLKDSLFAAVSLLFLVAVLWSLVPVGSFKEMALRFEDMYGTADKLPLLALYALAYTRPIDGWLPTICVVSFAGISWTMMCLCRRSSKFLLIATIAIIVLVTHRALMKLAHESPLTPLVVGPMKVE